MGSIYYIGILIPEYEAVAEVVDDDGLVAVDFVGKEFFRQVVEHELLDGALDGTGTEVGVVTLLCQEGNGLRRAFEADALRFEHVGHAFHLQTYNVGNLFFRERCEGDDLVDTVQELRTHGGSQLFARGIRRHDDDGVLEVGGTALVVRQTTVVKHLQEDVEHVGMGLLNLIEQHDGVGLAAYGLGQLTTLIVAYIARRCTNETGDTVLLLIFRHIDTRHHGLVVEEVVGQRLGEWRARSYRHP